jgi:undecaprenyl pyrophosphate phosphatase UppP
VRTKPTIQLYSEDVRRRGGGKNLGLAFWLGMPVLFGAVVYAATEWGAIGSWPALALLVVIAPAALVVLSLVKIAWLR